jgi:GNAT superfamily N-acetyltransferase
MMASLETALDHGLGYCLLDGDLVVSEAFAGPIVGDALEMATITHEAYRRRGLARIVSARTIQECERLGYRTWWNTGLGNPASAGLARKLGYRTERLCRVLAWSKSSTA